MIGPLGTSAERTNQVNLVEALEGQCAVELVNLAHHRSDDLQRQLKEDDGVHDHDEGQDDLGLLRESRMFPNKWKSEGPDDEEQHEENQPDILVPS